jgi:hypothetical protein
MMGIIDDYCPVSLPGIIARIISPVFLCHYTHHLCHYTHHLNKRIISPAAPLGLQQSLWP